MTGLHYQVLPACFSQPSSSLDCHMCSRSRGKESTTWMWGRVWGSCLAWLHIEAHPPWFLFLQHWPDAHVLAVQPQDEANLPGNCQPAEGWPPPQLSRGFLLLQRREQGSREWGAGDGIRGHGKCPLGSVLSLSQGRGWGPGGRVHSEHQTDLWWTHPIHPHERGQEEWACTHPAQVKPFLTVPAGEGLFLSILKLFSSLTASRKLRIIRTLPRCETELRDSSYTFLFVFWPKNTHVWLPTLQASGGLTVNLEGLGFPRTRPPIPSTVSNQDFVVAVVFLIDWKNAPVFTGISLFLLVSELQLVVKDRIYLWNTRKKAKERQTEKKQKTQLTTPCSRITCFAGLGFEKILLIWERGFILVFFSSFTKSVPQIDQ